MADVVYLHVGAPKTGTTYLQDRLYANRAALGEHKIHYPVGLHGDMFPGALDLIDRPWGGVREEVRGKWDSLAGRVRRSAGKVIVSHEILASATREQIARAMADMGDAEVHIVYAARDLGRQLPAEWQESLKHRNRQRFRRYVRLTHQAERRDSERWFWRVHGLPDVLTRWSEGLTPDRVHLVTLPQAGGDRDELWRRFCRAVDIDPALGPEEGEARANASIGIDEANLLRNLNRRLKGSGVDEPAYQQLVRKLVVHETLAHRRRMRKITLPPAMHDWAREVAEEWIEWVEGSGIDVCGDLADLRPVFDEDTPWDDPDQPKPKRMADAALDALVAVVLEAAERPDPDDSTVAKLGRAARRLRGQ